MAVWLWTILLRGWSAYPYNVGSPCAIAIADLARCVTAAVASGVDVRIAQKQTPGAVPSRYVPSTTRVETELGLHCRIPLEEGVRRTFAWHRRGSRTQFQ